MPNVCSTCALKLLVVIKQNLLKIKSMLSSFNTIEFKARRRLSRDTLSLTYFDLYVGRFRTSSSFLYRRARATNETFRSFVLARATERYLNQTT